jgi:capsular exopolysaccharide synthesis family protein
MRRLTRDPANDPAQRWLNEQLRDLMIEIEQIQARELPRGAVTDPHQVLLESTRRDIEGIENEVSTTWNALRDMSAAQEDYRILDREREQKNQAIAQMEARIDDFKMLIKSKSEPVKLIMQASEPTAPVSPNRPLLILGAIVVGLGLGGGLACFIERLDRKVRVPEQLTHGLGLPLFGVVPRMRRTARLQRGGHLWTPGVPTSVEADAYRNLRASLLGLKGPSGVPAVTILVTSAKAGEGKSTTALNLAATCARSGERTLLMDVDLRRASLAEVFESETDQSGLVGVLKGAVPWQRTVVRTDLPNLDFLPTGDPRDIPIEILGSLELRQLIRAVSGQYDRIILDGPAVLGMADCRMLGRIVDAAILVVRSGAHELRPLQRARLMLEQSHVPLSGVVFNALSEDYKDWSSYGSANYGFGDDLHPITSGASHSNGSTPRIVASA